MSEPRELTTDEWLEQLDKKPIRKGQCTGRTAAGERCKQIVQQRGKSFRCKYHPPKR